MLCQGTPWHTMGHLSQVFFGSHLMHSTPCSLHLAPHLFSLVSPSVIGEPSMPRIKLCGDGGLCLSSP